MIIFSPEMDEFILPYEFKFKHFDLKLINTLARNHPFQHLVYKLVKYSGDFLENEEYDNDPYLDEDYFILLDRYYKFGITFENSNVYYTYLKILKKIHQLDIYYELFYIALNNLHLMM